ncbi:unnamed protein product [Larinioides sclopetarius]|uniref:SET domain-containing protein n=1 Tax=Larinioides sclopetarius TaxID=280406 RepID=A0AAV2BWJ6_9ARAC
MYAGVSSDISVVIRAESPLSKTVTTTMINLRGVKPKEFAQNVLNSAQTALKALEDMLGGLEDDFTFDIEELNLSEPGCSKDTEPQRRYPKRNVAKKCYKEEEVPGEDEYLYCDVCNEEYRGSCPVHGPMLQVCDTKLSPFSNRFRKANPGGPSEPFPTSSPSESRASRGPAWACGRRYRSSRAWCSGLTREASSGRTTTPRRVDTHGTGGHSLPRKGSSESRDNLKLLILCFVQQVRKESKTLHYVEAADEGRSNWMRYVNCANLEEWQSIVAFQYLGKIYYKTYKPVLPFTELLVWYGNSYASEMGIELKERKGNHGLLLRREPAEAPEEASSHGAEREASVPGVPLLHRQN